jgi:adenylate kinase
VRGIVGISGTPGTGKKTLAPLVAGLLGLPPAVSVNSFARKGEVEVDTGLLRERLLKENPSNIVLYGHLLPYVLRRPEAAFVAVLRCEPATLRARLLERGYPLAKVKENVEAELIGVVLDECVARFGAERVRDYDTTNASPGHVARSVAKDRASARTRTRPAWIDWTLGYDSSSKLRSLLEGSRAPPGST